MKTRVISGVIGLILLLSVVKIGGLVLDFSVFFISALALYEFNNVIRLLGLQILNINNYGFLLLLFIVSITNNYHFIQPIIFLYLLSLIIYFVLKDELNPKDIAFNFYGAFYTVFLPYHVSLMNGKDLIWIIFITAWGTDTFAYFTGKKFGRRKLSPKLSPNKTIEGSIGGIFGSLIVTLIFAYFFKLGHYFQFAFLAIICSILSQVGDLAASKVKRIVKIKDYGNIMPGHGGILDRFDSILLTAPIVYYYIQYILY